MRQVIIGIHGLGNKPSRYLLQRWWKRAMMEGLRKQGLKKELPELEIAYWADILYRRPLSMRQKKKDSPYYLSEPYAKAPGDRVIGNHSVRKQVIRFFSRLLHRIFLNEDKSLNYSFIAELIVRKYFKDLEFYYVGDCKDGQGVTHKARNLIRARVAETIKRYQGCEIMVVAHSMGSIITFDVLNYLIPEVKIKTFVTLGSPLGFPIVLSKIAEEQKEQINGSTAMSAPPGVTTHWFNMADILDHVALNYKLSDDFTSNEAGVAPTDVLVRNDYEVNRIKNPHKSFGYLRTPEFAKVLSEFIGEEKLNIAQKVMGTVKQLAEKVKVQSGIVRDKPSTE